MLDKTEAEQRPRQIQSKKRKHDGKTDGKRDGKTERPGLNGCLGERGKLGASLVSLYSYSGDEDETL